MKLTAKQQIRIDILSKYINGEIYLEDAINALQISDRHFRRLLKSFREDGITSVLHGNKGRMPSNKTPDRVENFITRLYRTRYLGLNIVHFREKLFDHFETEKVPAYSTIRSILQKERLIQRVQKRKRKSHPRRNRYEKEGLMVQIDGSHHRWLFRHTPICLTAAIDDATGKILGAKFTATETTFAAMDVVESIIQNHGKFQMLYSDKAGIYGGGKRDGFSNMNRALKDLGIISIQANTPQAKGRVERLFRTLQSRLVNELKLLEINDIDSANNYLEEFIKKFNSQFGVKAKVGDNAYEELPANIDLNEVFTMREYRTLQNGNTVSYKGKKFVICDNDNLVYGANQVELRKYRDGSKKFFIRGCELEFRTLDSYLNAA